MTSPRGLVPPFKTGVIVLDVTEIGNKEAKEQLYDLASDYHRGNNSFMWWYSKEDPCLYPDKGEDNFRRYPALSKYFMVHIPGYEDPKNNIEILLLISW